MLYSNPNPPGAIFPLEWMTMFTKMSRQQVGEITLAVLTYCATGALPEFTDPCLDVVWTLCQSRLDSDRDRYQKKVERSRAYQERKAAETEKTARPRTTTPSRSAYEAKMDKWL